MLLQAKNGWRKKQATTLAKELMFSLESSYFFFIWFMKSRMYSITFCDISSQFFTIINITGPFITFFGHVYCMYSSRTTILYKTIL